MWKIVSQNPNYEVSDMGDVRRIGTNKNLKPWSHRSGHLYVSLGRGKKRQIHRLVLEAFYGPRPLGMECLHKDSNPKNNSAENLRWGTRKENIRDYRDKNGRHMVGSLSVEQAVSIRANYTGAFGELSRTARQCGVSVSAISKIIKGITYA